MQCEHCGGEFYNPGQMGPTLQEGCANCGRPLRNRQPGDPSVDIQLQKNMPAPGESDMGGNPLKEGILADGGWKNDMKRDESFASVKPSWNDRLRVAVDEFGPDAGAWPEMEGTPIDPGVAQRVNQNPIQGEGQLCSQCHGDGCFHCLDTGSEPQGFGLNERHDSPLMQEVNQVGPYHGNTLSQAPYLSYLAGEDPDFEIEEVEAPDAKSVKDKDLKKAIKEFEKQAGIFGDVWNGFKGAGQWAWHHPLEAAAIGGAAALTGGAALGVGGAALGAGAVGGEAALGAGEAAGAAGAAEGALGAGDAVAGLNAAQKARNAASWMGGAMKKGLGGAAKAEGTVALINQGTGMMTGGGGGGAPAGGGGGVSPDARTIQQITHVKTADDYETPTSHGEIPKNRDGDSNVKSDGDNQHWQKDYSQGDEGGMAHGTEALAVAFSPETESTYEMMFPMIHHYYHNEEDGSQHPLMQALHQLMESDLPGYLQHGDESHESMPHDPLQADPTTENHKEDNTDATDSQIKHTNVLLNAPGGVAPSLTQPVPQIPGASPNQSKCINGHTVDPSAMSCPQCGAPVMRGPGADAQNLVQPQLQAQSALGDPSAQVNPYIEEPDIPSGMQVGDYRHLRNLEGIMETCPNCGMKNVMGGPLCRGCGMSLDNTRTASDHQGPHTPEQIAAVAQYLQGHGRAEEISNMILQPWLYANELAQIQHNPDVPEGENESQPMPAQEVAPPQETMPMPGMSAPGPGNSGGPAPMMSSWNTRLRQSSDSVAAKCPKCDSHTTGLVDQDDGTSLCHSCGHIFKTPKLVGDDGHSSDLSTTSASDNFEGVPAAEQKKPEDPEREHDSTLTWQDEGGEPLKVGQQYKMKSARYGIPDIVRVEAVRPESIEYSIVGEYGIAGNTKVSFMEAQQDGLSFEPFGSDPSQDHSFDIEQNNDDATQREQAGMDTSDLSTPHQLMSATVNEEFGEYQTKPELDWLREESEGGDFLRTAGARFTPFEQREFIEEAGEARNREKLQLAGTHYESSDDDYFLFGL